MGLFAELGKAVLSQVHCMASDMKLVNDDKIGDKMSDFFLEFEYLLKNVHGTESRMELVSGLVATGIYAAKSDGNFSKSEVLELAGFFEKSVNALSEEKITNEEVMEIIRTINSAPIEMKDLGTVAINMKIEFGESAITTLRAFIEYIIYSDGELHQEELDFLEKWEKTVEVMSRRR